MGVGQKISDKLGVAADVISNQKHIASIKKAFVLLMPMFIGGAFAVLLSNMVFSDETGIASIGAFSFLATLKPITDAIQYATLNFLTIGAVFVIGLELAKINGQSSTLFPGVLALVSYITVIPTTLLLEVDGSMQEVANVLAREFTDPQSLFLGMFIAILSVEIYCKLVTVDRLKVKMPDSVPSNVATAFSALIPGIMTVVIISSFGFLFLQITGLHLHEAIYTLVQSPLERVMQGLPGVLILMLVAQVFWVIGIHGNQMVRPVREPILLAAITVNMNAFAAGEEIPNIITMPFWDIYMSIGGSGVTIGLLIAIFIVSRREDMKKITKLSVGPGIFNINEPVIFGMPVMLNPILAIPFILTPLVTGTIGYIATVTEFAGPAVAMIPWTTPPIISAYLATAGSIGAVITQIICIAVSVLIYLPFVIISNKQQPAT
ncbi:PTS system, cellobiose-specific IIC component [Amphibacillus marinus]|uniref:Permease IIC component n=1 Tax=Amphibacillus marinus TaxID=872970 RepID=A0A1H8TFM4_9BACI|nr:PTS transporter subunit EIIC [Amphibacillus marinus]SEO89635.1 PTS system, cellobiose-specific IIC component [Amphibacillus marinus]